MWWSRFTVLKKIDFFSSPCLIHCLYFFAADCSTDGPLHREAFDMWFPHPFPLTHTYTPRSQDGGGGGREGGGMDIYLSGSDMSVCLTCIIYERPEWGRKDHGSRAAKQSKHNARDRKWKRAAQSCCLQLGRQTVGGKLQFSAQTH